jgi:hypothetical protein
VVRAVVVLKAVLVERLPQARVLLAVLEITLHQNLAAVAGVVQEPLVRMELQVLQEMVALESALILLGLQQLQLAWVVFMQAVVVLEH